MVENGLVALIFTSKEPGIISTAFTYDHKRAIEGYKPGTFYCTCNIDEPNTYLKSIMDLLKTKNFRFTDGKIHRDDEKFILEETIGVILVYTTRKHGAILAKKVLIKDQDYVEILKNEDDDEIIDVKVRRNNDGSGN